MLRRPRGSSIQRFSKIKDASIYLLTSGVVSLCWANRSFEKSNSSRFLDEFFISLF